jgi:hypothetical protein
MKSTAHPPFARWFGSHKKGQLYSVLRHQAGPIIFR